MSKSRQVAVKAKDSLKLVEDQGKERQGTGDIKKTYQKRKVQSEPSSDRAVQDQMLAESQKRVRFSETNKCGFTRSGTILLGFDQSGITRKSCGSQEPSLR